FNDSILNEDKAFPRPASAIGREVKNCHPPKSLDMVLKLIDDLSTGEKDKESMWFPRKNGQFIHVTYVAVRDDDGAYMGILEYVQDIQPFRELSGMKRGLS
ncbi:MAG: PAS domain-containing protein, partial [Alkalibacterium sp.]|nr:PAS domain-containing protein [Alkalibacterium sp.]